MSDNYITLENITGEIQKAYSEEGVEYSIGPKQRMPFPEDIAGLLLDQRGKFVREYVQAEIPKVIDVDETLVWVANMTGNPFSSQKVPFSRFEKGIEIPTEIDNPKRNPIPLKWDMHTGQREEFGPDGLKWFFNLPKTRIVLPPHERKPVPFHAASFIINRDAMNEMPWRGQVRVCRAPGDFEPNMTWEVNDIILYSKMVDEKGFSQGYLDSIGAYADENQSSAVKSQHIKKELLQRLFYRLVDETFALPTRAAFEYRKAELQPELEAPAEVKRGRGRPRKEDSSSGVAA